MFASPTLFTLNDVSKCGYRCQWVYEAYISKLYTLFVLFISNGTAKRKMATLAFLYGGEFMKTSFDDVKTYDYRPQRSCSKVMFFHLCVSHFVHGGGACLIDTLPWVGTPGRCPWADTPLGRHPRADAPWADTPGQTPPSRADSYCIGRYASYWNAALFNLCFHMKT